MENFYLNANFIHFACSLTHSFDCFLFLLMESLFSQRLHIDEGALIGRLEPKDKHEKRGISPSVVVTVDFGEGTGLTEVNDSELNEVGNC